MTETVEHTQPNDDCGETSTVISTHIGGGWIQDNTGKWVFVNHTKPKTNR